MSGAASSITGREGLVSRPNGFRGARDRDVPRETDVAVATSRPAIVDRRFQRRQPDGSYRPSFWTPDDDARLRRLYALGVSSQELALHFGVTRDTLRIHAGRIGARRYVRRSLSDAMALIARETDR